ncbi:ABC transporter permease [Dactylosporangium sp. NPDC051484]|uniref:ABC transporter permease n=1 Tax=Dactylosporangium sp. NPDC051484 TaxID=3154942 RepID=UPI00344C6AA2
MSALGHVAAGGGSAAQVKLEKPRKKWLPYLLLLPGGLWLIIFFAVPSVQLFATSLYDPNGSLEEGYAMTWQFGNYPDAVSAYLPQFGRSIGYAALTTLFSLLLGYPLAYAIALKSGRWKNILLICVIAPFFTTFLIRTLAWKVILSDNGTVVSVLNALHVPLPDGRLLATTPAVIAGLVYNFLPFMVLPLYASLEKLDPRLIEAAGDLYARPVARFTRVVLPLSMPGVVAGTLLTFIPAAGDYINAELLGTSRQYMIGNVIQSKFLKVGDYPAAAALSFTLMAAILVLVFVYVRRAGTDEVL